MKNQKKLASVLLVFIMLFVSQSTTAKHFRFQPEASFLAGKFCRTELYFGTDKPGGGKVSAQEWDDFLEREVTPRFPEGFTVFEGYGQYKDSTGAIVREASRILVIFYPKKQRAAVDSKVEALRAKYKQLFGQESVLRLDFSKSVDVRF
ncbi:MAG TPA: DUF3574 domain-containing protein [Pyrinomonadaceae bacterium]|jgi:hypothetical protein